MTMTKQKQSGLKQYDIACSPLFALSSKRKLAELLGVEAASLARLRGIQGLTSQYRIFTDAKTRRFITEPVRDLLRVHRRLLLLLRRIAPPNYLHSAIKKRSYKTNAEVHINGKNVLKIDIKKFYPAVKFHRVHEFFRSSLRCSPDIAVILAKLCTVETNKYGCVHLPTGSCVSPILSFLVNQKMFDAIEAECAQAGCTFTVYVDDITISGEAATTTLLAKIASKIHQYGYEYHKIKTYFGCPAEVTGLIVNGRELHLPNQRKRRIEELQHSLAHSVGPLRQQLLAQLIGCLSEAEQIHPEYRVHRLSTMTRYTEVWKQVVDARLRKAKAKAKANRKPKQAVTLPLRAAA